MRSFMAAMAIALLTVPACAQGMGGMGKHSQSSDQKTDQPKKKVDEKGYNSALGAIPDKKYDPWRAMH